MSYLTNVQASTWEPEKRTEPEARTEPAPRSEPAARTETEPMTEIEPRTEVAARTEPANNEVKSVKCPSCGYLLVYSKGPGKLSLRCTKCGKDFQVE